MNSSGEHGFATLVIVAAGRSERFGAGAKVLEEVGGRAVLEWSLVAADLARSVKDVVIVTGAHTGAAIASLVNATTWSVPVVFVTGGATRQESVAAGLAVVTPSSDVVLIHDGARPLVTAAMFDHCASAARVHGAAILAVPVSDTLKRVTQCQIVETVPRDALWAAQTPQGFRRDVILSAIDRTRELAREFTDEASLLEALGGTVRIVPGERANIKITHREDLELVDALLRVRHDSGKGRG